MARDRDDDELRDSEPPDSERTSAAKKNADDAGDEPEKQAKPQKKQSGSSSGPKEKSAKGGGASSKKKKGDDGRKARSSSKKKAVGSKKAKRPVEIEGPQSAWSQIAEAAKNALKRRGPDSGARALSLVAIVAAGVIAVCSNVLVSRHYERWDWTSSGLYTLSQATTDTLSQLKRPVDVVVFLSRSDPLTLSVRHMLDAYGAKTDKLKVRWIDPDRNPAEFQAMQKKYGIVAGKTEDGRVVTDASIVMASGEKHWFITTDDIVVVDENDGSAKPRLEEALTGGLRNVLEKERVKVCFTSGHREVSADDGGQTGMAELKFRLQKDNYETEVVDMVAPTRKPRLAGCGVVVMAGPEVEVSKKVAEQLRDFFTGGGSLLLMINPLVDDAGRFVPTGLEPVMEPAGIQLGGGFIIEQDERYVLPSSEGQSFFVTPKPHPVTRGLVQRDEKVDFPVEIKAAQSIERSPQSPAKPLLVSSAASFSLRDIRPLLAGDANLEKGPGDPAGPLDAAVAVELPKPEGSSADHGPRMVVVGTASPILNRSYRLPILRGNWLFTESAVAWLAARGAAVSVPDKETYAAGLQLTEESIDDVFWYVIVYMPGAALLLGGFVMYRRRASERRSRRDRDEEDES